MIEMVGLLAKEWFAGMMDEVEHEMTSNDNFLKGVMMAAAFILLLRQIYLHLRRGQQLTREALVSGIKESTDEIVEDFTRLTNEAKEKIQGMKLRNSKVLPDPSRRDEDEA